MPIYLLLSSDLVGRIQIPVKELMDKPNQMVRRDDKLMGFEDADSMSGTLSWSVGYFEKVPLRKELERGPTEEEQKNKPAEPTKTAPEMEMLPGDAGKSKGSATTLVRFTNVISKPISAPNPAKKDLPPPPPDILKTRPDPEYPSGVLNVTIHHVGFYRFM